MEGEGKRSKPKVAPCQTFYISRTQVLVIDGWREQHAQYVAFLQLKPTEEVNMDHGVSFH